MGIAMEKSRQDEKKRPAFNLAFWRQAQDVDGASAIEGTSGIPEIYSDVHAPKGESISGNAGEATQDSLKSEAENRDAGMPEKTTCPQTASELLKQAKMAHVDPQKADPHSFEFSDCESFLKARNDLARSRDNMFMERFGALREYQIKIEEALDRIKRNPITLRAMADWAAGAKMDFVITEAARRRADNFSDDSTSLAANLRDFERQIGVWTRLAQLSMEAAMLAPMPELGRPFALQKNIRIFLNMVCKSQELQIYHSEKNQESLYNKSTQISEELEAAYGIANETLEQLFRSKEQPMDYNVFSELQKEALKKEAEEKPKETLPQPQPVKVAQDRPEAVNSGNPVPAKPKLNPESVKETKTQETNKGQA